jgi:DNA-binding winged helix-turn-helix (wHTH) protein/tetratricopeptide (TPR) repeat protein
MATPSNGNTRLRFGTFEVDLARQELSRRGVPVHLQDKPFQILAFLLARRGEIVTREELQERLWPDGTFVEFDKGLNTAVKKLRQALLDSADSPIYIETLPRRGYRFIAPVEVLTDGCSNHEQKALGSILNPAVSTVPQWKRFASVVGAALVVGLLALLGFLFVHRRPGLTQKDTVVLADFDNRTGDAVFDETLKQALAIELGQSPFLNILPSHSVLETLRYMGRSPDEQLTTATALEICERRAIKAVLTGSISKLGRNYVIALEARNCRTGESLAQQQVEVQNKEQILRGLEGAASKLRAQLGESLTSIQRFDAPFEQATTNSLEALQAYSLAQQQLARPSHRSDAIPFLENAIELDPNFATAYAALGHMYAGRVGKHDLSIEYLKKAFELRHRVSEREKFFITAEYHGGVTRNLDEAIDNYELWRRTYPRDVEPLNALAATYNAMGQYERALEYAQEAIPLRPDDISAYGELVSAYLCLSRWQEAKGTCEKAIAQKLDGAPLRWPLYTIAMIENDPASLRQQLEWAKEEREETKIRFFEAMTAAYSGKRQQFRELFSQTIEMGRAEYSTRSASMLTINEAIVESLLGDPKRARNLISSAQPIPPEGHEGAAVALSLAGDAATAERLVSDLETQYPQDTLLKVLVAPTVRAAIEINRNNPKRANALLQVTKPYERARLVNIAGLLPMYLRGKAYLQLSAGVDAAREFQKIVDNRGVASRSTLQALARYGLARAYALQNEKAKSRAAYQEFFALWKDADADIPPLKEAKAEYEKVK